MQPVSEHLKCRDPSIYWDDGDTHDYHVEQQRDTHGHVAEAPRFKATYCSQCGRAFGPGDHGYSHCKNHISQGDGEMQGTAEWHETRRAKLTASRFKELLVEPRSKKDRENGILSASANAYMLEKVFETLTGRCVTTPTVAAMQWGKDFERWARDTYQDVTGRAVDQVDFCIHKEHGRIGCSPDGLIGDVGGFETKCPYTPREHLKTLVSGIMPPEHTAQVQGSMWVTNREWWDFVSYDPRQVNVEWALAIVRVERDDAYIKTLERACLRVLDKLDETIARIRKLKPALSEAHRVAHLLAPPIRLFCDGQSSEPIEF